MTIKNQITGINKLVSDETRLRLLLLLLKDDLCVCELSGILDAPQPKISKILSKLRDMDLVIDDRQERYVYYHLKKDHSYLMALLSIIELQLFEDPIILEDQQRYLNKESYSSQCAISDNEFKRSIT